MRMFDVVSSVRLAAGLATFWIALGGGGTPHRIAQAQDRPRPAAVDGAALQAASSDPVLVVSIGSLNKLKLDINYLSAAAGQPQAGGLFGMMADQFTMGLDANRPLGVFVPIVDGAPEPIGVIPTNDVEMLLKRIEAQAGPADKLDDGTLVIAAGQSLVYIRQVGTWAVVARQKDLLDLLPADPMAMLDGMGDAYDLAVKLNIQEAPLPLREMLIENLRQGFEQAVARQADDAEAISAINANSIEQLETFIRDTDQLLVGLNVDPNKRNVTIQVDFTAVPGSELAAMYANQRSIPSQFTSVIREDAAMYYHAASSIDPAVMDQYQGSLDAAIAMLGQALEQQSQLDELTQDQVKAMAEKFVGLLGDTMREGKFDLGVKMIADDSQFQFVGGMFVSDGQAAAEFVKEIAAKVDGRGDAPVFRFDESQYSGVSMHSVLVDLPQDATEARELFGDQLDIKLGTGPKAVYFAIGRGSVEEMKQLIDSAARVDTATDRPLGRARLRLLPVLRLSQSIRQNDTVAAVIDALAQAADTDYVAMEGSAIANGSTSLVEFGEGIVKAIGAAVREAQMQRMRELQPGGGQF